MKLTPVAKKQRKERDKRMNVLRRIPNVGSRDTDPEVLYKLDQYELGDITVVSRTPIDGGKPLFTIQVNREKDMPKVGNIRGGIMVDIEADTIEEAVAKIPEAEELAETEIEKAIFATALGQKPETKYLKV